MKMKIIEQLELDYAADTISASRKSNVKNQKSRASLWFARMRQIVDRAIDCSPAPPPNHRQLSLNT